MKKILLTLTTIFTTIISFAQKQSNCNIPSILFTEYDEVVTDLAIRRMYQINSPDTIYVTVPQTQKDTIWEGLAAIFNAPSVHGWDTIFNKYCIKQDKNTNFYFTSSIYVELDTNYAWTEHWINEELITGYTELDSFLARNNYNYVSNLFSTGAYLGTDIYSNNKAFTDSIIFFEGINNTTIFNGYLITYNYILYNKIGDNKYYDFVIRYGGDCQSGCQNWYTFKYKVETDCSVEFLGIEQYSIGYPFPSPTNCNIEVKIPEIKNTNLIIYPNPVNDKLYIKSANFTNDDIFIYNIYGQITHVIASKVHQFQQTKTYKYKQSSSYDVQKIDVSTLPKGIYFIKIGSNSMKFTKL